MADKRSLQGKNLLGTCIQSSKDKMLNQREVAEQVYTLASVGPSDSLSLLVKEALGVIESCLDIHGWVVKSFTVFLNNVEVRPKNVALSFNGGKDCACLASLYSLKRGIHWFAIRHRSPTPICRRTRSSSSQFIAIYTHLRTAHGNSDTCNLYSGPIALLTAWRVHPTSSGGL